MTLGPYFVWEPWTDGAGWRPFTDLYDPDVVAGRVDAARQALLPMFSLAPDDVPVRVIASITFLGWASRLLSPPLGAAVTQGVLPIADPARLWWRPAVGGPLPMAAGDLTTVPCADLAAESVAKKMPVDVLVRPLLEVFQSRFRLSPQVLWGNVASALAGAGGQLAGAEGQPAGAGGQPAGAEGQPAGAGGQPADRAMDIVAACLTRPPLAGAGTLLRPDPTVPRRVLRRRNCCLYYRIPGGGTCADCVLRPPSR